MTRTGWLAVLIVVLAPWPSPAQFGGMGGMGGMGRGMGGGGRQQAVEEWTARFETFNGQSVTGKIQLPSVEIACSLGLYEIKPEKVKAIQFKPAPDQPVNGPSGVAREGTVLTDAGESVAGKINVPYWWRVETELGTLTPDAQQLKSITLLGRAVAEGRRGPDPARPDAARPAKPVETPPAARAAEAAGPT